MASKPTNVTPHELGFGIVYEVSLISSEINIDMAFVNSSVFKINGY